MSVYTAHTTVASPPETVMEMLTDPDSIERWAPVPFEVSEGARLVSGSRAQVSGGLVGRRVSFEVDVTEAGRERLALTASGPVTMDVEYRVHSAGEGTEVQATVSLGSGRGFAGRLLARATGGLLAGGALQAALARIAGELEPAVVGA